MNDTQQKEAARQFAAYWKDKGYEKGESHIQNNLSHLRSKCILITPVS